MSFLVSVDTGISACGVALWTDGKLSRATLVSSFIGAREPVADRVVAMARAVEKWMNVPFFKKAIVEYPRTYGGRSRKGDANDLILEALVSGAIATLPELNSRLVLPQEWKGTAPKGVTEERCHLDLSEDEIGRVVLPKSRKRQSDVWDAVGIGLWWLKKEGKR